MPRTVHRQCTLCEAHCGINVEVEGSEVLRITGDPEDTFSKGYICPKAAALTDLYTDPDRLRQPVRRTATGWEEIGWDEALDFAAKGLVAVQDEHGADAVATYIGNPSAHNMAILNIPTLRAVLGTRNNYSATSADQLPQHLVCAEMFGNLALFPIPDLNRVTHLLVLGANPSVSNGSVMTAPGARHRLKEIMERGGRVVVVDPRRTETANLATEHVGIRPGGDPYLLLGMLHTIFEEGLGRPGEHLDGLHEIETLAREWSPERAAPLAGIDAPTIERLARDFATARTAAAYGRVGVCQQQTGSLTHWLIVVLNAVTGNLDSEGGAMFTNSPVDVGMAMRLARLAGAGGHGSYTQRTTGYPEMNGELPVAGLIDEITTPGKGQVRGMLVFAGNPVLSTPGGVQLDAAMEGLDFCVAVDMYVTETSRHADVILPPCSPLERADLDIVMPAVSIHNHIRYSPPAVPKQGKEDWEIVNALISRLGRGHVGRAKARALGLGGRMTPPERMLDAIFAVGPHGVLRKRRKGVTVKKIKAAPHGIDLGPLEPRFPGVLMTPNKKVQLAPPVLMQAVTELERFETERAQAAGDGYDLVLIGRRQLHNNNSWMHNSKRLTKQRDRCTALLHPDDATTRGLENGAPVLVTSRIGSIELPVEISDEIRPGVVSIPHGFGHKGREGLGWTHAAKLPGPSVNDITDPAVVDQLTGNAGFNAVPVKVELVAARKPDVSARTGSPVEVAAAS